MDKLDDVYRQLQDNREEHNKLMEKIDKFGEKLDEKFNEVSIAIAKLPDELTLRFDERYASKETETSMKRIMWIIITGVVTGVLALVIKG